jgi:hypothetical protein
MSDPVVDAAVAQVVAATAAPVATVAATEVKPTFEKQADIKKAAPTAQPVTPQHIVKVDQPKRLRLKLTGVKLQQAISIGAVIDVIEVQ